MGVMIDMQIIGDSLASRMMCEALFAKLEPGPIAGFLLGTAAQVAQHGTERAFAAQSTPGGSPWAQLAPYTIEDRLSQGYSEGPIQYRSGELYSFFQGAQGDIYPDPAGTSLVWPGVIPAGGKLYSKVGSAQMGNKRTGAPPRPAVGLTLQDAEKIMLGLFEYVVGVKL